MGTMQMKDAEQDEAIANVQASTDGKQDKLIAGSGISISGNTISSSASAGSCTEFYEGCALADHIFNNPGFTIPSNVSFSLNNVAVRNATTRNFYLTTSVILDRTTVTDLAYNRDTNQIGKLYALHPPSSGRTKTYGSFSRAYMLSESEIQSFQTALNALGYNYSNITPLIFSSPTSGYVFYRKINDLCFYDNVNNTFLSVVYSNNSISEGRLYSSSTGNINFKIGNVKFIGTYSENKPICFAKSYITILPSKYFKIELNTIS